MVHRGVALVNKCEKEVQKIESIMFEVFKVCYQSWTNTEVNYCSSKY